MSRSIVARLRLNSPIRSYSSSSPPTGKPKSPHAQWYSDVVPAMIPVAILGSAVYLGLQLAQVHLAHEKYMDAAENKIRDLESELAVLRTRRDAALAEKQKNTVQASTGWWW